jgi:hypothetical protein
VGRGHAIRNHGERTAVPAVAEAVEHVDGIIAGNLASRRKSQEQGCRKRHDLPKERVFKHGSSHFHIVNFNPENINFAVRSLVPEGMSGVVKMPNGQ